jgi:hypothetical protein
MGRFFTLRANEALTPSIGVLPSSCSKLYAHAQIFLQPQNTSRREAWQTGCNPLTQTLSHRVSHTHKGVIGRKVVKRIKMVTEPNLQMYTFAT